MKKRSQQSGVTSIFVVIFFMLLIVILTVGFIKIMLEEQRSALNNDLSQRAYDSAMAGVEDAKRAIYACQQGDAKACEAINSDKCSTISDAGIVTANNQETTIRSATDGKSTDPMNQAYTCVKVMMKTDDYIANLKEGQSTVVPLRAAGNFSKVRIEWMHKDNGSSNGVTYLGGEPTSIKKPTEEDGLTLPYHKDWNENAPSLLRVQALLPTNNASSMSFSDLDSKIVSTYFLRPVSVANNNKVVATVSPISRAAGSDNNTKVGLTGVACSNREYQDGNYACGAEIDLGSQSIPAGSSLAMLRLTSMYRDTSFRITLYNKSVSPDAVKFDGVQPIVDSTGRANDVFRRVQSRLNLGTNEFPYPENAVDLTGSLCKNFYVTNDQAGASNPKCTP